MRGRLVGRVFGTDAGDYDVRLGGTPDGEMIGRFSNRPDAIAAAKRRSMFCTTPVEVVGALEWVTFEDGRVVYLDFNTNLAERGQRA